MSASHPQRTLGAGSATGGSNVRSGWNVTLRDLRSKH